MAAETDHAVLLGDASDIGIQVSSSPRKAPRVAAVLLGTAAVASAAAWKSRVVHSDNFRADGVMSAAEFTVQAAHAVCEAVYPLTHWPRSFDDMNWEGHCSDDKDLLQCKSRIIEKFVGDYFDLYVKSISEKENGAVADDKLFIPASSIDRRDWKKRVIERVKDEEKGIGSGKDNILITKERPPKWLPTAAKPGAICTAIYEERPAVTQAQLEKLNLECRPSHVTVKSLDEKLNTHVPLEKTNGKSRLCDSREADGTVKKECDVEPDTVGAAGQYPAEHSWDVNASLAKCRHLFSHKALGQDFVSSTLTVLDVRKCLQTGSDRLPTLSRSWVRSCLPKVSEKESPRTYGWPGWILEFVGDYGIVGSDCVADYEGLLKFEGETCPSLCDDGESLAGHIKHPTRGETQTHVPYRVIFNSGGLNKYNALTDAQHKTARQIIYSEGPLIGLVLRSQELAACASEDTVIFEKTAAACAAEVVEIKKTTDRDMHSVVVHGWGSEGGTPYYRIMSSVFQDEDHEAKIAECALKMFVLPSTSHEASASSSSRSAAAVCPRTSDFCTNSAAGYTDTEDCDGDGFLDHYCYLVGDSMTPSYEAFISSRKGCKVEESACRRSVLPGRKFGCQRPLGWCMYSGESYRRDVDCDGDGHFDHVCEKTGHNGFISSASDCSDTWEEGAEGRKCEPRSPLLADQDATVTYKLVVDSGSCVQHSSTCVKSHADWPNTEYPVGGCNFHVEWSAPPSSTKSEDGCDKETVASNETLGLQILHMDIEDPHFVTEGYLYGERFKVNGVLADSKTATNKALSVHDKSKIEWHTDSSVQKRGWLACLRLKTRTPKVYSATCTEIGDDIWARLDVKAEDEVVIQCDMTKCGKDKVKPASPDSKNTFMRTVNLCDAGWQTTKSSKFTIAFNALVTADEADEKAATFQVGF